MLVGFGHPHNYKPHVQIGFRTCWYLSNLLCIDNLDLLPVNQYIFLHLVSTSLFSFLTRSFNLRLASKLISRYLALFSCSTGMPLTELVCYSERSYLWSLCSLILAHLFIIHIFDPTTDVISRILKYCT